MLVNKTAVLRLKARKRFLALKEVLKKTGYENITYSNLTKTLTAVKLDYVAEISLSDMSHSVTFRYLDFRVGTENWLRCRNARLSEGQLLAFKIKQYKDAA